MRAIIITVIIIIVNIVKRRERAHANIDLSVFHQSVFCQYFFVAVPLIKYYNNINIMTKIERK